VNRQNYNSFFKDEASLVGGNALKSLPQLCALPMGNFIVSAVAQQIVVTSIKDAEDSVQLLLPPSLLVINSKLSDGDCTALIISLCTKLFLG
jgi:hypothetical protein